MNGVEGRVAELEAEVAVLREHVQRIESWVTGLSGGASPIIANRREWPAGSREAVV